MIGQGTYSQRVIIDGKECDIKRIDEARGNEEGRTDIEQRKVFVGGLAETVDSRGGRGNILVGNDQIRFSVFLGQDDPVVDSCRNTSLNTLTQLRDTGTHEDKMF